MDRTESPEVVNVEIRLDLGESRGGGGARFESEPEPEGKEAKEGGDGEGEVGADSRRYRTIVPVLSGLCPCPALIPGRGRPMENARDSVSALLCITYVPYELARCACGRRCPFGRGGEAARLDEEEEEKAGMELELCLGEDGTRADEYKPEARPEDGRPGLDVREEEAPDCCDTVLAGLSRPFGVSGEATLGVVDEAWRG